MEREKNLGTFFPWPGEKPGSGNGVTLRVLTGTVIDALDRDTTEERNVVIEGALFKDRVITDPESRERGRLDYIIVDWKGYTEDGTEIPCTAEEKVRAMKGDPAFARFVTEKLGELQDLLDRQAGIVRKNSGRSRNGS